jgi:quercetin dioxygenase-like cupin family protein
MTRNGDAFAFDSELPWEDAGEGIRRKALLFDDGIMMARVAFETGAVGAEHDHRPSQGAKHVAGSHPWASAVPRASA